ncbi:hypothetical protein [Saccharothrix sp.]|uniref:hypothetical protein n=1 Tax=Saccharothrix sp. TaxID=1873460 RepID=UPI0028112990|nr:hypothetical protein [Saccharothrix sp.]
MHGIALVEQVLESVRQDPGRSMFDHRNVPWVTGEPTPLPTMPEFPSGRPLSPSLQAWLAYDRSLFTRHGWFADDGTLTPRPLDELVTDELGWWGECFTPIADRFPECFLLPGGSDSRRVLAVGEPDSMGEYPILAIDVDDLPFAGLMYPGFDIYAAHTANLLDLSFPTYTALATHPTYASRMQEHSTHHFSGTLSYEHLFQPS